MKRKNILLITVRADIGGGPIHINELVNNIDLNKNELFLACPFSGSIYTDHWKPGDRIMKLQEIPFRKFSVKSFFQLINFARLNNIDIVHSHGKGAGIYSRLMKLFVPKFKVVHTFHGVGNILDKGVFNRIKNIYLERILKKFTAVFISVSNGEKQLAISNLKIKDKNIEVIYNGVKDQFNTLKKDTTKSVISFSRFTYEKNMMASYEIVKKSKSNIAFIWIGDGDDFNQIKQKMNNDRITNLNLLGFKNQPQKYLTPQSIYLSTSRHEGLPLALLEAEANGIPIVATDVVGNNEIVIDGFNGFLFSEGDIETAVDKIELLFKDPILYRTMSKNARADYLSRFTVVEMVRATEKIYDEIFV